MDRKPHGRKPLYLVPGFDGYGLQTRGNIDIIGRPGVRMPDGSSASVRSISVGFGDTTYLIPTVVNGRVVTDDEAVAYFRRTGQHLGAFYNRYFADRYADLLHRQQERSDLRGRGRG